MTDLVEALHEQARRNPAKTALICNGEEVTFEQLDKETDELARRLRSLITLDERVCFLGFNSVGYFRLFFAALKAGGVPTPVNWRLAPPEAAAVVRDAQAHLVFVDDDFIDPLRGALAQDGPSVRVLSSDLLRDGRWQELAPAEQSEQSAERLPREDPTVLQIYTSGTTGLPKGVMSADHSFSRYLDVLGDVASMSDRSVTLSTLPLFHIGGTGWVLGGLLRGATAVLLQKADVGEIFDAIERYQVTTAIAVPAIIRVMLESDQLASADLSSLSTLYYGAGPISQQELATAVAALDCGFVQGFGMTECGLATALTPEDHRGDPSLLASCGRPVKDTEIRLVSPRTGLDVEAGQVGELWIRSPIIMSGYWHQPDVTAQVLSDDGWLKTGDAGVLDESGYLYLKDRLKDVIVSGGENVYSGEVEAVLVSHKDVVDCAVIGVPSVRWTETVKAIVVTRSGVRLSEADIIDYCRARIARYKCPTSVEFVEAIPRNPSGKILKHVLRDQFSERTP